MKRSNTDWSNNEARNSHGPLLRGARRTWAGDTGEGCIPGAGLGQKAPSPLGQRLVIAILWKGWGGRKRRGTSEISIEKYSASMGAMGCSLLTQNCRRERRSHARQGRPDTHEHMHKDELKHVDGREDTKRTLGRRNEDIKKAVGREDGGGVTTYLGQFFFRSILWEIPTFRTASYRTPKL